MQGRRITMLVLWTDLLLSIAFVDYARQSLPGGLYTSSEWEVGACVSFGFSIAAQYVAGASQLVMVLAMNYTIVLERNLLPRTIERLGYGGTAFVFVFTWIANTLTVLKDCSEDSKGAECSDIIGRWNLGYAAIAASVVIAYCIAAVRLIQRRREIAKSLAVQEGEGFVNQHGEFVLATKTKAERLRAEKIAKMKKRALRDAVLIFTPYTLGFLIASVGDFVNSVYFRQIQDHGATPALLTKIGEMGILQALQPLFNFAATLIQPELREQLDPRSVFKRLRRRKRRVRMKPGRDAFLGGNGGGSGVRVVLPDDPYSSEDTGGCDSPDESETDPQSSSDEVSYAAADGKSDGVQLLSAST